MIRWGLILAVVIIAAGAWFDWTYHAIRTELADLRSRLNDGPGADITVDCARVDKLQSNPIAKMFKSEDLEALAKRCDEITSRDNTPTSP
jgi:hypothetical protein